MKLKRIYDDATKDDGVRILVDRVWPRGVSKEKANLDEWMKEIGPSKELRKWFNHEVDKFAIFAAGMALIVDTLSCRKHQGMRQVLIVLIKVLTDWMSQCSFSDR